MSNETRWTWYYTSWILLASVLLARSAEVLFTKRRWFVTPVLALCVLILAAAWVSVDYQKYYLGPNPVVSPSFNAAVYEKAGIHNAFAYDQPGGLAYYSDVHIVPLDGLMGNLQFQHDLATKGIAADMAEDHIEGFIGPPASFDKDTWASYCGKIFLMSKQFHCTAYGDKTWWPTSVDIYARFPFVLSGTIALDRNQVVWTKPGFVTVWKVNSQAE